METFLGIDLQTWWYLVIGAVFTGYTILDGFDDFHDDLPEYSKRDNPLISREDL